MKLFSIFKLSTNNSSSSQILGKLFDKAFNEPDFKMMLTYAQMTVSSSTIGNDISIKLTIPAEALKSMAQSEGMLYEKYEDSTDESYNEEEAVEETEELDFED